MAATSKKTKKVSREKHKLKKKRLQSNKIASVKKTFSKEQFEILAAKSIESRVGFKTADECIALLKSYAPKPPEPILSWVASNIVLSRQSASEAGAYNVDRTPYFKEIYEAYADDTTRSIALMFGTQLGKSTCMVNCLLWKLAQDPTPTLLAMPTQPMVKSFVVERIESVVAGSSQLHALFPSLEMQNKKNASTLARIINGVPFNAVTMGSSVQTQSRPVGAVFIDEIDEANRRQGIDDSGEKVVNSLINRTDTYPNSKIFFSGTPTYKDYSLIENRYLASDKRVCMVPCPHCNKYQQLSFKRFYVGTKKFPHSHCVCKFCKEKILEHSKFSMLAKCKWIATAPFNGAAGFRLHRLYSPFVPWEDVARKQKAAETSSTNKARKDFVNNAMAETWDIENEATVVDNSKLMLLKEDVLPDDAISDDIIMIVASIDVQGNHVEGEFIGYGGYGENGFERWHLEYFRIDGSIDFDKTRQLIIKKLAKKFKTASGQEIPAHQVIIDAGHCYNSVALLCSTNKNLFIACKGRKDNRSGIVNIIQEKEVPNNPGILFRFVNVDTDWSKQTVYTSLLNKLNFGRTHFPKKQCYNAKYFRSLCAEKRVEKLTSTGVQWRWEMRTGYEHNEALDINGYAETVALMEIENINRMSKLIKSANQLKATS